MRIDILTLFPKMFEGFQSESIIKRAIEREKAEINIHNIRDYAKNKHKRVDDTPYGGGAGMVLMCQPIFDAIDEIKKDDTKIVLLTPQGVLYDQKLAYTLSKEEHLVFICGHYEGFDERISSIVDMEISIGDYILTGGELPSMVVTDSIVRLIPGVIDEESHQKESFNDNLLDYPNYTKPKNFKGMKVPDVLLSGHHYNIEKWRQTERIIKTMQKRPDLFQERVFYSLIKDKVKKEIVNIEYNLLEGLDITPKNNAKRKDVISVTKMVLIKRSFIEKVIKSKIEKKIKILVERFNELDDEDGDPDDTQMLVNDIERYKRFLLDSYIKYLGLDHGELVLKKLQLLLNELMIRKHLRVNSKENENVGKSR